MARATKDARHITVNGTAYRWRATGNDGWISLTVWPASLGGPAMVASFGYHETRGSRQVVITNRLVRRVIELAVRELGYDPARSGPQLDLRHVDERIDISDAIRAGSKPAL